LAAVFVASGFTVCAAPSWGAGLPPHPVAKKASAPAAAAPLVDLNSASREQLKTLHGIGDAEADRIVAGRPWLTKTALVSKNVIPTGVYLAIKNSIIATPPNKQPKKGS
jgi:DNA uptake protein ComE-like DNA-binding protein